MQAKKDQHLQGKIIIAFFAFALGIAISSLVQKKVHTDSPQDRGLFEYKGKAVTIKDLAPAISVPLYEEMENTYKTQLELLKSAALQLHIKRQAQANSSTEEVVTEELLTPEPATEEEVNEFWHVNKDRITQPFGQIKGEIEAYITQQKALQKRDDLIKQLEMSGDIAFSIMAPESPVIHINTEGYPYKGNVDASIQLVEFADYQCPHCKTASETVKSIAEKWGDKIKITYMDFPINRSGISRIIAHGAVCADQQNRFWEFHDKAFENQQSLSKAWPEETAEQLGLDMEKFNQCLTQQDTLDKVSKSEQQAVAAGVRGTPAFFLNGIKISGHDIEKTLDQAIGKLVDQTTANHVH